MATALAFVALIVLIVTLGSTLIGILTGWLPTDKLMEFTRLLLSWQVIAGGLAIGGGKTFQQEISGLLTRIAK